MECHPAGCARWRLHLEPGWEVAGGGDGYVGLVRRPVRPVTHPDDQPGALWLRVLDAETGAQRWQAPLDGAWFDGVSLGTSIEVVFASDLAIVAVGPTIVAMLADGTTVWESTIPDGDLLRLESVGAAIVVTVGDPREPSSGRHVALDRDSGDTVFEVEGHPHALLDDQALMVAVPDGPGMLIRRLGLADGSVLWERAAEGWSSFPRAAFVTLGPTIRVVPLIGGGVGGGDLLVDRRTGEDLIDVGGVVAGGVSLTTGSTVILVDTAPSSVTGTRRFHADWFSSGAPQQLELLIIDPDGQPAQRGSLDEPLAGHVRLAADGNLVTVIHETGAAVTFEMTTGTEQPTPTGLLGEPRSYTWSDPTGRQITRTPDTILVETEDAAVRVTGRALRIVHDAPTVIQQEGRLLGLDPVTAPPTD